MSAMSLAVLLLAACGSSGIGDILGGGGGSTADNYEIRGIVDHVDTASRSIYLTNVSGYSNMLSSGTNNLRVYYEDQTRVEYQGQTYRPENLERGDQVSMRVDESGNTLVADSVTVLRDVSSGTSSGGTSSGGSYASTIRGTVRYIDTSRRTVEIDRGLGSITTVEYESSTPVYYNNQTYRTSDLERGDEVDVRLTDLGNGRWIARDITVTRSVSGGVGGSSSSSSYSSLRGTVRSIDTVNRSIQLESISWISRFSGSGGGGSTTTVYYGSNLGVEVGGRVQPMSGLERGDVVEVQVNSNTTGSYLTAQRVILVRDVRQ